jgi:hypothetical protein
MRKTYRVLSGFRVGAGQRWLMPDTTVTLLECEAQYALSRGWLVVENSEIAENDEAATKKSTVSGSKKTDNNLETN